MLAGIMSIMFGLAARLMGCWGMSVVGCAGGEKGRFEGEV